MKFARMVGVLFGILGTVLMVGTVLLCLTNLNTPARLEEVPQEAALCAQSFLEAVEAGELEAAAGFIYGQPQLGTGREPATAESKAVWQVFLASLSWEYLDEFQVTDRGLARTVGLTALEIPTMTGKLLGKASALMNERVALATTMEELYDETGNFRADLIDSVMVQAMDQMLAEGGELTTWEFTLEVVNREDRWWVLPGQAFYTALSGGV